MMAIIFSAQQTDKRLYTCHSFWSGKLLERSCFGIASSCLGMIPAVSPCDENWGWKDADSIPGVKFSNMSFQQGRSKCFCSWNVELAPSVSSALSAWASEKKSLPGTADNFPS